MINNNMKLGKEHFTKEQWGEYKEWLKKEKKPTKNNPNQRKKKNSNKEKWLKKKEEVFNLKGVVCCVCGKRTNINVYYLGDKKEKPWKHPIDDLAVLCYHCYQNIKNNNENI